MRAAAPLFSILVGLLACSVNTDPVFGDGDGGQIGGAFDGGSPTFYEGVEPYAGCDVDLTCTAGCADDLDCEDWGGGGAGGEPDHDGDAGVPSAELRGVEEDAAEGMVMDGPGERWLALGESERRQVVEGAVERGTVVLAAYDPDDGLVARSTTAPVIVIPAQPAGTRLRLRVVATGEEGAALRLARSWLDE